MDMSEGGRVNRAISDFCKTKFLAGNARVDFILFPLTMLKKTYLFLSLFFSLQASAQIIGAEIDYACSGNGRYEVFVYLNRYCGDSAVQPQIHCLAGSDSLLADSVMLLAISEPGTANLTGLPQDSCMIDTGIRRMKRYCYRGVFDLDTFSACQTIFFIREPTTNFATTLNNRIWFYLSTQVNRCLAPCDASPISQNVAPLHFAQNQDLFINQAVYNPLFPQDSFHYSYDTAYENRNVPAVYIGSYYGRNWIGYWGFPNWSLTMPTGLHIDGVSGNIFFRPTQKNQKASMVVRVETYRKINGMMTPVGQKYIENGLTILSSPGNLVPKLNPPYASQACIGTKTCFTLQSDDDDVNDTTQIIIHHNPLLNLEITDMTSTRLAKYKVCWTPDSADVRSVPYSFTAEVVDNAAPLIGRSLRGYSFFVREPVIANPVTHLDTCGKLTFTLPYPNNVWANSSVQIKDNNTNTVTPLSFPADSVNLEVGSHYFQINLRTSYNCKLDIFDTFQVMGPIYPKRITQSRLFQGCIDDRIQFGQMNPEPDVEYLWNDGNADPFRHMTLGPDTTILFLNSSRSFCALNDTFRFVSDSIPNPGFTANWQDSITFQGGINFPLSQATYLWILNDSLYLSGPSFSITGIPFDTVQVHIIATNGHCQSRDSLIVRPPLPNSLADKTHPKLYPNPFSHSIFIDGKEIQGVRMFNALGQEIEVRLDYRYGKTEVIPVAALPTGVYWLRIETEAGYYLEKMIKD